MKLAGIQFFSFRIQDFLGGTSHMDTLEKGAYLMLLLCHYQNGENGLPDDDVRLARMAGLSLKVWSRIRPILAEKFTIKNSTWEHSNVIDTLREVHLVSSKQRTKALKRHNTTHAVAVPQQCQHKHKQKQVVLDKESKTRRDDFTLPDWIDENDWLDFVEMRGKFKGGFTDRAKKGIIKKLEQLTNEGHDPKVILENSIINSWKDVYPPKGTKNELANEARELLDQLGRSDNN